MIHLEWLFLFLLFILFEQMANVLAKQFAVSGKYAFVILSLLCFVTCELPWIFSLRIGLELSKGAVLFSVVPSIGMVLIGLLVYHEKVSRAQFVGIVLGIVAIIFLLY
jgi:multidrug transporter EmrE-like cation transporter